MNATSSNKVGKTARSNLPASLTSWSARSLRRRSIDYSIICVGSRKKFCFPLCCSREDPSEEDEALETPYPLLRRISKASEAYPVVEHKNRRFTQFVSREQVCFKQLNEGFLITGRKQNLFIIIIFCISLHIETLSEIIMGPCAQPP